MSTANRKPRMTTKDLTLGAMFTALAYVSTLIVHIEIVPAAPFLTYDPKDIIITLGGLILGPVQALLIAVAAALIELVTISDTGVIGFIMNALSSSAMAVTAALIYHRCKTLKNAVLGIIAGCLTMVVVMLLWNYIVTPMYMKVSREMVLTMLPTVFLPFNLIKGSLNGAVAFLMYRPIIGVLRSARLLPASEKKVKQNNWPVIIAALAVVVTCVLVILSMQGII